MLECEQAEDLRAAIAKVVKKMNESDSFIDSAATVQEELEKRHKISATA